MAAKAKFELKTGKSGKFSFNLKATNGQVILTSETYEDKKGATNGIKSVKKNAGNDKRYEIRTAKNGEQYFVLKASNGEIIGKSETYKANKSLNNGIASVKKNGPVAETVDLTAAPAKPAKKAAKKETPS
jgi:uncharacterized protein